jgi:hypothetical protein
VPGAPSSASSPPAGAPAFLAEPVCLGLDAALAAGFPQQRPQLASGELGGGVGRGGSCRQDDARDG